MGHYFLDTQYIQVLFIFIQWDFVDIRAGGDDQTIRVILYLLTYWQYVKKSIFAPNKIYMCTAFCGPKNWGPHSADRESVDGPEKADVTRRGSKE